MPQHIKKGANALVAEALAGLTGLEQLYLNTNRIGAFDYGSLVPMPGMGVLSLANQIGGGDLSCDGEDNWGSFTDYDVAGVAAAVAACGAAGSCLVSVPQEVLKQRLVTGVYSSFREAVRKVWQTEGLLGFYSGWRPTMSRNVPERRQRGDVTRRAERRRCSGLCGRCGRFGRRWCLTQQSTDGNGAST